MGQECLNHLMIMFCIQGTGWISLGLEGPIIYIYIYYQFIVRFFDRVGLPPHNVPFPGGVNEKVLEQLFFLLFK